MLCETLLANHLRLRGIMVLVFAMALLTLSCSKDKQGELSTAPPKLISLDTSNSQVKALAFSPDGQLLAGAAAGRFVRVWNTQTGEIIKTIDVQGSGDLHTVSFSPDGKMLAAGTGLGIPCWDTQTWKLKWGTGTWMELLAQSLAFSPDSKLMVSGDRDGKVSFWDATTGARSKDIKALGGPVLFVAFLPDRLLLASGSSGKVLFVPVPGKPGTHTTQMPGEVALLDASTGKIQRTTATNDNDITHYRVAFSQDGKMLATRGVDDLVELWDAQTGQVTKSFKAPGKVYAIAVSPDGTTVATAGEDKIIRLWRLATGELSSSLAGHEDSVTFLMFSPDGSALTSASADKTVKLWKLK